MAASRKCEVVIVGAGLSGLSAAKLLHEQGIDVVVLEAEDRVGGRLHTARNPSAKYVDLGGAYIGPTQNRVFRMLKEYGLKSYKIYEDGDHLVYYNGQTKRLSDAYVALGGGSHFMDVNNMYQLLDKCIEEVPADRPWDAPKAMEWDQMTLQAWMDKVMYTRRGAYEEGKMVCRLNYTAEPTDVSFLWVLWYTKLAGGVLRINSTAGGAQERKVVGGTQQMPENIAASLSDRVYLKQPVRQLENFSDGVTVRSQDMTVEAGYVILATPPALQRSIEFSPPLPTLRNQLIQRVPMGSAIKVMVYYKRAYWREKGFSGTAYCLDDFKENPVCCAIDDTKPDGSFPCLVGFVTADSALFLSQKSKEERLRIVAKQYSRMFQCKDLLQPVHYEDKDWGAEQWTAGCYTGVMGPGVLTTCGSALREPIGRMYLAGTETATEWTGYMEGAIQAGERAAREILCKMGNIPAHEIWQSEPESKDCPTVPLTRSFVERNTPSVPGLMKLLAAAAVVGAGGLVLKSKM